jgi:hypothetical protein
MYPTISLTHCSSLSRRLFNTRRVISSGIAEVSSLTLCISSSMVLDLRDDHFGFEIPPPKITTGEQIRRTYRRWNNTAPRTCRAVETFPADYLLYGQLRHLVETMLKTRLIPRRRNSASRLRKFPRFCVDVPGTAAPFSSKDIQWQQNMRPWCLWRSCGFSGAQ